MYLEGSDQHRGWFQSSLLESCGTRGRAPFDIVLTHGFTLDENGRKMSKSLGNQTFPQDVIRASGADILRLWVASVDYTDDQRIGPEILKAVSDNYRKLRNTIRWMLGTLAHREPGDSVGYSAMSELERLMLHRLAELDPRSREAYANFDYARVIAALTAFMNADLSAFYFDIRKDALYCDPPSSARGAARSRRSSTFSALSRSGSRRSSSSPARRRGRRAVPARRSVHLEQFPAIPAEWRDDALAKTWDTIRLLRLAVTGAIEIARANKLIGSSLEAAPRIYLSNPEHLRALEGVDFAEVCITSDIAVEFGTEIPEAAFRLPEATDVGVVVERAQGVKCARSWRYFDPATASPDCPDVTPRDAEALRELKTLGRWPEGAPARRDRRAHCRHRRPSRKICGPCAFRPASDRFGAVGAVPRFDPAMESRHFVQPVRPRFGLGGGGPARAHAGGDRLAGMVALSMPVRTARRRARTDHRRRPRQCHRSPCPRRRCRLS